MTMRQSSSPWPGRYEAAVSLTYDDALPSHLEVVAPLLDDLGLRATFYVPIDSGLFGSLDLWRKIAKRGNELGNHTIFHPCRKKKADWPDDAFDLKRYTMKRLEKELAVANTLLWNIDGEPHRTFGNTCHDTTIGPDGAEESMEPILGRLFMAARGEPSGRIIQPAAANRTNLGCWVVDGPSFEQCKAEIDRAVAEGGWIIFCAHRVSDEPGWLTWSRREHRRTLCYLAEKRKQIWTAPVIDVSQYLFTDYPLRPIGNRATRLLRRFMGTPFS